MIDPNSLRPDPLVSLCMIVRDSARTLADALRSIRPWVDEMIVVDTGSNDDTVQIARQYGAKVYHFPWCDDFSAARNASLRPARGRWLFWMDSDDTIDAVNGRKLRELSQRPLNPGPMAFVMQVHCPGPTADCGDVTVVDHVKMFRNLPVLCFEGRIHEQILPAVRRAGGDVAWTDVSVVHSGSDQTSNGRCLKQERDLRLLHLDLDERPGHPFVLFNIGMTYADMGDHEKAIVALRECIAVSTPTESHLRKAYALLACSLSQHDQQDEAWETCQQGLRHFVDDPELWFRSGIIAHGRGNLDQAVCAYHTAIRGPSEHFFSSRDRGITSYKARHNLALVHVDQGRDDLAELQWREVVAEMPGYRPAWRGLGESLVRQGRIATAEVESDRLLATPALAPEGGLLRFELARARGNPCGARQELRQALRAFPEDPALLSAGAKTAFEDGDLASTEAALIALCRCAPSDGAAHHNLGTVYMRLGRWADAESAYERSLAVRPGCQMTHEHLEITRERQRLANKHVAMSMDKD